MLEYKYLYFVRIPKGLKWEPLQVLVLIKVSPDVLDLPLSLDRTNPKMDSNKFHQLSLDISASVVRSHKRVNPPTKLSQAGCGNYRVFVVGTSFTVTMACIVIRVRV